MDLNLSDFGEKISGARNRRRFAVQNRQVAEYKYDDALIDVVSSDDLSEPRLGGEIRSI
jgi:hypothetical protein